jgi:hypothetical protein
MCTTANGVFIAWDPLRPTKSFVCAFCGKGGAKSKCGNCRFAAYCDGECQRRGWSAHADSCNHGYAAYVRAVETHTAEVATLQSESAGQIKVIAAYESALEHARAFGDAEGERHLHKILAFRYGLTGDGQREATHTSHSARLEEVLGILPPSKVMGSVAKSGGLPPPDAPPPPPPGAAPPPEGFKYSNSLDLAGKAREPAFIKGAKTGRAAWGTWEQSMADMTALVALPAGTRSKQVKVEFRPRRLSVRLKPSFPATPAAASAPSQGGDEALVEVPHAHSSLPRPLHSRMPP